MHTANNFKSSSNIKTEKIEYKLDEKNYLISLIYNSEEIAFNIKSRLPLQYDQFESKFNLSDMKTMNQFFAQFTNIEKIAGLYSNLFKNKKINISEEKDELNLSFMNITDDIINLSIKKKEFAGDEKYDKLLDIMKSLINEIKELKSENKKMKEQIDELTKFKLEIEEERREKKKYYSLKDSNILNDPEKIKMISDWINPNKKIIYNQIYKATRDGGTGKNFHSHCDNKGPTLTLINSTNGYIFGGFISISWEGPENWTYKSNDDSAFIFSINNKIKYPIQDKSSVIYNQINYGPDFGSNDIFLCQNFLNDNSNQCNRYKYYNASPEKLSGGTTFQVKELEVYSVKIE